MQPTSGKQIGVISTSQGTGGGDCGSGDDKFVSCEIKIDDYFIIRPTIIRFCDFFQLLHNYKLIST